MSEATAEKATEQFESLVLAPLRAYGSLNLEYTEKLVATQFDAARALTDMGLSQAREWLTVTDADSLSKAMEGQQKAGQEMGERLKGDVEKVMALSQEYVQKGQKLVEENLKAASAR